MQLVGASISKFYSIVANSTSCIGKLMGSHSRLNKVSISEGDDHLIKMTTILTTPIQPCIRWSIIGSVGLRHIYLNWSACYTLYKCMKQSTSLLCVKFLWITLLVYRCSICFPHHIEEILITILVPSENPLLYITNLLVLTSQRHSTNLYTISQVIPPFIPPHGRKHPLKIKWKWVPHQVQ